MEQTEITIKSQPKWKSKIFWIAISSIIAFILGNYGLYDVIGLTSDSFQTLLNLIFAALAAFGVWNDAGNKENY